jgi:hypothetical protein
MRAPGGGGDGGGVEFATHEATRDDGREPLDGMVGEELQHADVVPRADARTESPDECRTQLGERGGQLPVAVHRRVIESGGLTL